MAGEKLLSETSCKTCKPKVKVYYLNDGGGLRLRIRPDGTNPLLADSDGDDYLDGEEVESGADPLDANNSPSEGLNWHVFKAAKDQQEEAAQKSN